MKISGHINYFLSATVVAGVLMSSSAQAQFSTDYLKAADTYFAAGDYASAAAYYEKYLHPAAKATTAEYNPYSIKSASNKSVKENTRQALYRLAESYRLLTDYGKAEPLYKQLIDADAGQFPLAYLSYATVLRAQAKYADAETVLHVFLERYNADDASTVAARRELQNLQFIQQQLAKKDVSLYTIAKLADGKEGASYAPAFGQNDELYFTTTWAANDAKTAGHTNHIFKANYAAKMLGTVEATILPEDAMHEGTPAISADGNTLYFTKWQVSKAGKKAAIYKSNKDAGKWTTPVALHSIVNETGTNAQQPLLLPDGKSLIFASDKKGGLGGYDLWIADLNSSGDAISVKNLGENINTAYNDEAPAYHTASGTLVFSSNGRVGMGGYDLFYAKGTPGNWSPVQNFGYPVNSIKDDIYFAAKSGSKKLLEDALISSDRTATCCLELFSVSKIYKQYFYGTVVDCNTQLPLAEVAVIATDATGKKVGGLITDNEGQYFIEATQGTVLTLNASNPSYENATITTTTSDFDTVQNKLVCLKPVAKPTPTVFKETKLETRNILFAFNDAAIPEADYAFFDQVADYLKANPESKIEIGAYTDGKGTVPYNLKLSAKRAQSCYDYLVKAGIEKYRLVAKGYGECCPLEKEFTNNKKDNPAAREKNRRVEVKLL